MNAKHIVLQKFDEKILCEWPFDDVCYNDSLVQRKCSKHWEAPLPAEGLMDFDPWSHFWSTPQTRVGLIIFRDFINWQEIAGRILGDATYEVCSMCGVPFWSHLLYLLHIQASLFKCVMNCCHRHSQKAVSFQVASVSTLQCPTYSCRNPVIPVEFHWNKNEIKQTKVEILIYLTQFLKLCRYIHFSAIFTQVLYPQSLVLNSTLFIRLVELKSI